MGGFIPVDRSNKESALKSIDAGAESLKAGKDQALIDLVKDADAVITQFAPINAAVIGAMQQCRVIVRYGIGVDNVDLDAATKAGIVVTKVPDYCIDEVSDHAMALLLTIVRKIPAASEQVHAGVWKMPNFVPIYRLRGSTLGLAGFGRIPQLVVPKAQAFGIKVVAYDPFVPAEVFKSLGVEQVDFEQLLSVSDYISVHCPLTPETKGLFGESAFKKMKKKAYLVNTARGPVVDEAALAKALDAGEIAGAGLDVMTNEPPVGSPLLGNKKVIITPHTSFYSEESLVDLQTKAAQEVANVLTGKPARNPVNQVAK